MGQTNCISPTAESKELFGVPLQKYVAKEAYTAQFEDEISFPKNATIEVIEKSITGWWNVRYGDGYIGVSGDMLNAPSWFLLQIQWEGWHCSCFSAYSNATPQGSPEICSHCGKPKILMRTYYSSKVS